MSSRNSFRRSGRPRGRDEWRTPRALFDFYDSVYGFKLDAAANAENSLCDCFISVEDDALDVDWPVGPVWVNPPYSRSGGPLTRWLERAVRFRELTVVAMVPADTSTRWWYRWVAMEANVVNFLVGRPKFLAPDGSKYSTSKGGGGSTVPIAVVTYEPCRPCGKWRTVYLYSSAVDGQPIRGGVD